MLQYAANSQTISCLAFSFANRFKNYTLVTAVYHAYAHLQGAPDKANGILADCSANLTKEPVDIPY